MKMDWRFWILMAPQYHALMLVLVVFALILLVRINSKVGK